MKRTILLDHFSSINNYGTGMMGVILLQELNKYPDLIGEIIISSNSEEILGDIKKQIPGLTLPVSVQKIKTPSSFYRTIFSIRKKWEKWKTILNFPLPSFSPIPVKAPVRIVLGGDDLSEYYINPRKILQDLIVLRDYSQKEQVFLLGQTIGPFKNRHNVRLVKQLANCHIFIRDKKNYQYITEELELSKNVSLISDLAYLPLPGQETASPENVSAYGLVKDEYVTCVVSGLYSSYTPSKTDYLSTWQKIISSLLSDSRLQGKKICLLAHTHPPFDNESNLLLEIKELFSPEEQERLVWITEKISLLDARLILGSGLFTITGRMHAAVSTYQMKKPAIALSYSVKYAGVIGEELFRDDLVMEARNHSEWNNNSLTKKVAEKVDYLLSNYDSIVEEIKERLPYTEQRVKQGLTHVMELISGKHV